jgi:hypothetical protein
VADRRGTWFDKPAGVAYEELYRALSQAASGAAAGLWGRQMTLGPTPEFCLLSPSGDAAHAGIEPAATVARRAVCRNLVADSQT